MISSTSCAVSRSDGRKQGRVLTAHRVDPLTVLGYILGYIPCLAVAWALRWEGTVVFPYLLVAHATVLLLYAVSQRPRHPRLDWSQQVAVVTGSSGGLGSAIVAELRGKGCRVVGVDLAAPTAQNDSAAGDELHIYLQADVSRSADIMALPEKIRSRLGCDATILISNAGIMVGKRVLDFDDGQFDK